MLDRCADAASRSSRSGRETACRTRRRRSRPADKVTFIDRLSDAGLPAIEVSAFVNPKRVPQMADAADVFARIARCPGTRYTALVPNLAGLDRAAAAGVSRDCDFRGSIGIVQPREHQQRHRRVICQLTPSSAERARARRACGFAAICRLRSAAHTKDVFRRSRVAGVSARLIDMGVYEVAVSDTIGVAHPGQVAICARNHVGTRAVRSRSHCTSMTRVARHSRTC